jgi:hypothetical protein
MNATTINRYYTMLEKFERKEITQQQWFTFCAMILGVIMEENKENLYSSKKTLTSF